MEHLDYLWTYLWYIMRHVTFVIYVWHLWYICGVGDIYVMLMIYMWCWWCLYIYLLFVWMGCKKQIKRLFSVTLPSAMAMTLGKVTIWKLPGNMLCRVEWPLHSANIIGLPSATGQALGKGRHFAECLVSDTQQSGHLCWVSYRRHSAKWPPLQSV